MESIDKSKFYSFNTVEAPATPACRGDEVLRAGEGVG
jgi:hypothetical protein